MTECFSGYFFSATCTTTYLDSCFKRFIRYKLDYYFFYHRLLLYVIVLPCTLWGQLKLILLANYVDDDFRLRLRWYCFPMYQRDISQMWGWMIYPLNQEDACNRSCNIPRRRWADTELTLSAVECESAYRKTANSLILTSILVVLTFIVSIHYFCNFG